MLVASIYAPNGNPQPGPKFDYKLAWLKRLNAHAAELYATGAPVVLAGDYNVVPTDLDIYPTKSWDRDALSAAREPRRVSAPSRAGLDRRHSRAPSQRTDVHVLGLHAESLGTRWRSASRPHSVEFRFGRAPARCRRRSSNTGNRGRQRPCARMGGASRCAQTGPLLRALSAATRQRRRRPLLSEAEKSAHPTGGKTRQRTRAASADKPELSRRPLLVIDGDSFAHRSYHALPKTIRRSDGKGAGAILGFANFLLRFYADEQPRAVVVGWDSLDAPTKTPRNVSRLSKRARVR